MSQRNRIILIFFAFYFLCAFIGGHWVWSHSYQSLLDKHQSQLERFSSHIQNKLDKYAHIPHLLSKDEPLVEALLNPENSAQLEITNRYLESVNGVIEAADTYLIDKWGTTIAASNWRKERSFVGRNFAFRPYFKQAITGQRSQYYALGSTSGKRGYYYSYPIVYAGGVLGVVVVKMDLSKIEDNWQQPNSVFVASDPNGIVFMSSRNDWLFKSLLPLEEPTAAEVWASRQYLNTTIDSLGFVGDMSLAHTEAKQGYPYNKGTLVVSSLPLENLKLTIRVLSPKQSVIWFTMGYLLVLTLVFTVLFLVGQLIYHRQQRHRQIERIQQEANQKLEYQVMARTAELQAEIAQRIETEQTLRVTQDELVQAAKLAVLGQMSASISHELNNPLAAIRSFAENGKLFLHKEKYERTEDNLTRISALTDRMANISQQLRSFAKKTSGNELAQTHLLPVIASAKELMKPAFKSARVTLNTKLIEQDVEVQINTIQLEQVLVNLLTNAIEATKGQENKQVHLSIEKDIKAELVWIYVDDNGTGLGEFTFSQLCEPFLTTKQNGLGLGLSISQQILAGMNGKLSAQNREQGGARFSICLPLISSHTT
ncbi:Signal transduction histidine kinase regulating C4-dicarboxylate transport system [Vibrio harveyi]|uniref:sensor histidine kinase n=1 Tax=Vibrio harveyi TaxID=669 RepID=UPI001EFDBC40|nr:ATP-binding protein [Vibrio harveyi]MCG9235935.1 ATP-binding protein [Vibrio harveyi]MCG9586711.1 ATP-binding protein [Vibrio harveyi]CAH1198592.1 Signal transduction histidine kinase regulating C4-dicarboxylate transport system [Vibrio harveyi]CAH1550334.1 Signal transduction histidine kinase regulating C4-dicarboxylate transport system [Vibrio harveyi]CAH1556400.1 Signal transduction histidine kinase regulating C4-dicarboxylate transport system [Vibrio harveyi]